MTPKLFRQQHRPTPSLDASYWSFMLGGLVEIPLPLSYQDLTSLPITDGFMLCRVIHMLKLYTLISMIT